MRYYVFAFDGQNNKCKQEGPVSLEEAADYIDAFRAEGYENAFMLSEEDAWSLVG